MKKVLSLILTICMFGAFAISVSADESFPSGIKLAVTETETGAVADVIMAGTYAGLNSTKTLVGFDTSKLTYDTTVFEKYAAWDTQNVITSVAGKLIISFGALTDDTTKYLSGKDTKILTVKFNKVDSAKLVQGDIKLENTVKVGRVKHANETWCNGSKAPSTSLDYSTFTAYTPDEPDKPSFVIPEDSEKTGENSGIVDINTNAETGAYSVKVTAPIGKKAVIYIDGVAQTGSEIAGTATKATTIKVAYEDVTDEVITYVVPMSSIYGAEDGIAAFGKGTIAEGVEYGIKFGGLKGEYKGITDYKFPAKGNVGGIFGVEVKDAPAGDYTAQAYVGDAMGAAISFTK